MDKKDRQRYRVLMFDIHVIDDRRPRRWHWSQVLAELAAPASTATLATRVGLGLQKVNYHLHTLLTVDIEVHFRSPSDRAAFTHELTEAITKLVSKYHDASARGGRAQCLVNVSHPLPKTLDKEPQ